MKFPQWATPERRNHLVELFLQSNGFCVLGHPNCPHLLEDCYEVASEGLITDWKAQDREERERAWKRERRRIHTAPQIRKRGPFDTIARERYLSERPVFRLVGIGMGAFTQKRVALVELPGLKLSIFVDLAGIPVPKKKLRKLFRHPKGELPQEIQDLIQQQVRGYFG